ncbi:MAG: hypothetical protein R2784_05095 [Saprospiraceae bacterium]
MSKKRIAVIGGGLGSMTTIYSMLNLPGAKDKYEFTVYQLGWRVGKRSKWGKFGEGMSSGRTRNPFLVRIL